MWNYRFGCDKCLDKCWWWGPSPIVWTFASKTQNLATTVHYCIESNPAHHRSRCPVVGNVGKITFKSSKGSTLGTVYTMLHSIPMSKRSTNTTFRKLFSHIGMRFVESCPQWVHANNSRWLADRNNNEIKVCVCRGRNLVFGKTEVPEERESTTLIWRLSIFPTLHKWRAAGNVKI